MAAGAPLDKRSIDDRVSNLGVSLNVAFDQIRMLAIFMATKTDQSLLDLGYAQADVNLIKSAVLDMEQLRQVFEGTATIASGGAVTTSALGHDFRAFMKLIWGFGY